MSLPIPLTVALKSTTGAKLITKLVGDLSYRWAIPGGFASGTVDLDRPLLLDPEELAYYGTLAFYDGRSGETVFEGRVEDLGRSAGQDGQVWRIVAIGPAAHASDRTVPYVMVDQDLSPWVHALQDISPGATGDVRQDVGGSSNDSLHLQLPNALPVVSGSRAAMRYDRIWRAGQKIARVDYTWDAGLTNADYSVRAVLRTDGSTSLFTIARTQTTTTAGSGSSPIVVVTNWPNGRNTLDVELTYTGAPTSVGGDVAWASIMNMAIVAMRYNAAGIELTTGYTTNTVLASDVVADLLGRLLTQYDGATASIATTSYDIDQLAYPDGVTSAKVLQDLLVFHPDMYWAAWEKTANGKHRFEWTQWPTTPRYEATIVDGFDSPGSATELWNAVTVRGRDAAGNIQTVRRTSTVPALDAAGLIRETFVDLGDEIWSATNANRAGDQFLAEHQYPPNAGSLTVARPILDTQTGRMVSPWEILPGLIRVRGVQPAGRDALNPEGRDGVTTFRVVGMDYQASRNTATLELDSRPQSVAHMLADAARAPRRRRR